MERIAFQCLGFRVVLYCVYVTQDTGQQDFRTCFAVNDPPDLALHTPHPPSSSKNKGLGYRGLNYNKVLGAQYTITIIWLLDRLRHVHPMT